MDDHEIEACRQAVSDFRASRGIADQIKEIDGYGFCWQKSG